MKKVKSIITILTCFTLIFYFVSCAQEVHEHTFSDEWTFNEFTHWHKSTCEHADLVRELGEHDFSNSNICSICGYEKTITDESGNENQGDNTHEHTFTDVWTTDTQYHWHKSTCEHKDVIASKTEHSFTDYIFSDDSSTTDDGVLVRECKVCGYKDSKPHSHEWVAGSIIKEPTCKEEGLQYYTCTCGKTKTEILDKSEHSFDEHFICSVCGNSKKLSVEEFLAAIPSDVSWIKYKENIKGIVRGEGSEKNTLYVGDINIYGQFSYDPETRTGLGFPKNIVGIDFTGINTAGVTSMRGMFANCGDLQKLNISTLNTSSVTDMSYMFCRCDSVWLHLDVSSLDTSNVTNMECMFYYTFYETDSKTFKYCANPDFTNFNTSKVTNMRSMFEMCSQLTQLDIRSFDTSNVTDMSKMFYACNYLKSIDLGNFNTSKVTTFEEMFGYCQTFTTLNLDNFDTGSATTIKRMFVNCDNLQSLNLSKFNTSNVTDMCAVFGFCESLKELNISNFDTSKVTTMIWMFYNCKNLTSINLQSFNTRKVEDMGYMFDGCEKLTSLDLSSFYTDNLTGVEDMFCQTKALTSINMKNFNTSKLANSNLTYTIFRLAGKSGSNLTVYYNKDTWKLSTSASSYEATGKLVFKAQ